MKKPARPPKAVARLAEYWLRADIMNVHLHSLIEKHGGDIGQVYEDGKGIEMETYLSHWLSGLFVVVEGFNKLGLRDAQVQKLFKAQIGYLKRMRHETYHFSEAISPAATEIISHLNWAEELHQAIGGYLWEVVERKANIERLLAKRVKASVK